MVEQDMPADWAIERALTLLGLSQSEKTYVKQFAMVDPSTLGFARYIEAHEEAPVDPIRAEADKLYEAWAVAKCSNREFMEIALRRGMELAKEQGK